MPEFLVSAILFDMDGTLVDSTALVESIWTEFAAANHSDPREVIAFAHGRPSRDTITAFAHHRDQIGAWNARFARWEAERFDAVRAIPGAVSLVGSLPSHSWAIVTSALREPARRRLTRLGFPAPPVLIGADDVTHGKPHPEGYLAAARILDVDPVDCVVFEDTPAGIQAGLSAGCTVVGVGREALHPWRVTDMTAVTVTQAGSQWRVATGPS